MIWLLGLIGVILILGLIALFMGGVVSLVLGLLALSGLIAVVFMFAPGLLTGSYGQVSLSFIAIGLIIFVSGWFVAEQFYDAGVRFLNAFTDPYRREFWYDHEAMISQAQGLVIIQSKAKMGRDALQIVGKAVIFFGVFLLFMGTLVSMFRPSRPATPAGHGAPDSGE